jgi:hypothetical protein
VLERDPGGQGKRDVWSVSKWTRDCWPTVPEVSGGFQVRPATLPEVSAEIEKAQENDTYPLLSSSPLRIEEDKSGTVAARLF